MNSSATDAGLIGLGIIGLVMILFSLAASILMIVSCWKIFTKAGKPGWASLIPFFNVYVLCEIAGKPGWWLFLFLIPVVNLVIGIMVLVGVAEKFGKGVGFAIGLIFLPFIFYPILAFGDATYEGAA